LPALPALQWFHISRKIHRWENAVMKEEEEILEDVLGSDGRVAQRMQSFRFRPGQMQMARSVMQVLAAGGIRFIEAGTGTGKSLAYLVPAIVKGRHAKPAVVISTNTINLQEQLLNKDLPLLQEVMPFEFKATLVKGRANYICMYRLRASIQEGAGLFEDEEGRVLNRLLTWARDTDDGSRSDLDFPVPTRIWDQVSADSERCLGELCPSRAECFVVRARSHMLTSELLLVNHHLLCADLAVRRHIGDKADRAVLPGFDSVIIDEAHHLQDVATKHLGEELSQLGLVRFCRNIYRSSHLKTPGLVDVITGSGPPPGSLAKVCNGIATTAAEAENNARAFFAAFTDRIQDELAASLNHSQFRLTPETAERFKACDDVSTALSALQDCLANLQSELGVLSHEVENWTGVDPQKKAEVAALTDGLIRQQGRISSTLSAFLTADDPEYVYWVELGRNRDCRLRVAPINAGDSLRDLLFKRAKACVLTSATLSVSGDFSYIKECTGADLPGVTVEQIPSSFNYRKQVLLCFPSDIGMPGEPRFIQDLVEVVTPILRLTSGRAFLLFTSYSMLKRTSVRLRESIPDVRLLVQGTAPRHKLLETFKDGDNCVLLGTDSFWEGVDVPGPALSCVIITKLPFQVPTDPITAARSDMLRQKGSNPFTAYMLPEAVIKLRQGFGRLIRRREDRGVVVVCDKRMWTKRYGHAFLCSLPDCQRLRGTTDQICEAIRRWLALQPEVSEALVQGDKA